MPQPSPAPRSTDDARDTRPLLPLWRITGTLTSITPLSIGSGHDEPIVIHENDGDHERFVIAVTRDHRDRPYIPGSSLKGALKALADEAELELEWHRALFGAEETPKRTLPARVEFCDLPAIELVDARALPNWRAERHTANLPHVARNRDYGTAEDQHLFLEQVVPAGSRFAFECTARAVDRRTIAALLGLLALAGDGSPRLGGGRAAGNGCLRWRVDEVRRIDDPALFWRTLSQAGGTAALTLWTDAHSRADTIEAMPLRRKTDELTLGDLTLDFHTPFLVHQAQPRPAGKARAEGDDPASGIPRTNGAGEPILPASSLHGALRSQAERILRTVGLRADPGYAVPGAYPAGAADSPDADMGTDMGPDIDGDRRRHPLDLASILFGAPGWRSILRLGDFVVAGTPNYLEHHMIAIDRITGGGKDGAKFAIRALDCPVLAGAIAIDLRRLRLLEQDNPGIAAAALGLLAHAIRDLDEGDIALGYGAAKGYGRSRSLIGRRLEEALTAAGMRLDDCLSQFAARIAVAPAAAIPGAEKRDQPPPPPPPIRAGDGAFHNPYVFIPFGNPGGDSRLPWSKYDELANSRHSHARYAPEAFNGRLICRLTTRTPIFIGAGDRENTDDPKQKKNFTMYNRIALPATSLRGMLSGLHEAITRSALRVMDNRAYSVRTNQPLPKRGELIRAAHVRADGNRVYVWKILDRASGAEYLVPPVVLERLNYLCDERTDATRDDATQPPLPNVYPEGIARNGNPGKYGLKIRPVAGQIVHFRLDDGKVGEMAYSKNWRKLVAVPGTAEPWRTIRALPDIDFSPLTPERATLSPSELLFGAVESDGPERTAAARAARAFATKVTVGFGRSPLPGQPVGLLPETTLKILSSPKPPSPAMYFRPDYRKPGDRARQGFVSKAELAACPANFQLRGRKMYLHARRNPGNGANAPTVAPVDDNGNTAAAGRPPWQSQPPPANADHKTHDDYRRGHKQRARVQPIDRNQVFIFEVDFINLDRAELESLCACLSPHAGFEHKLGMGKPIGLGSVKIEMIGLYLVDRQQRYRQTDFTAPNRYATAWKASDQCLPPHLELEQATSPTADGIDPVALASAQMAALRTADPAVFNALLLAGNPDAVNKPVHYPQCPEQSPERNNFEWFANNEKTAHQHLEDFTETSCQLPSLNR